MSLRTQRTLSLQNLKVSQSAIQTWGHNRNILGQIKPRKVACTKTHIENTLQEILRNKKIEVMPQELWEIGVEIGGEAKQRGDAAQSEWVRRLPQTHRTNLTEGAGVTARGGLARWAGMDSHTWLCSPARCWELLYPHPGTQGSSFRCHRNPGFCF